jgi:F-type H+-transporting ATPase subunit gamma
MAKSRDIAKKIRSVSNTMKITRTMEMVATVRAKKAQERLRSAQPYWLQLVKIVARLLDERGVVLDHPLFRKPPEAARRAVLLVVTSDRGFCGGYNTNIIEQAKKEIGKYRQQKTRVDVELAGKKGISHFRSKGWREGMDYRGGFKVRATYTGFDDRVDEQKVKEIAESYIGEFERKEIDEVRIVCYEYAKATEQKLGSLVLLPVDYRLAKDEEEGEKGKQEGREEEASAPKRVNIYEFLPSPDEILRELIPSEVKTSLFTYFLGAGASEQIARRIAMKQASDNALDMIKALRRRYNRARQAQITLEISDIIGGAAAIAE